MNNLNDNIIVKNNITTKKELLKKLSEWVRSNFIMNANIVRVPNPPKKEFFDDMNADYPIIEEFRSHNLTGNEYLIASLTSIGIAIGRREKEIEISRLEKRIKELENKLNEKK